MKSIDRKGQFIKRLLDDKIQCKVEIKVLSIKLDSILKEPVGPFAVQIVRGPLKSDSMEFTLAEPKAQQEVIINHLFTRDLTLMKSQNDFQKKAILLRLLQIEDSTSLDKKAKVLSEVSVNLGSMVGKYE